MTLAEALLVAVGAVAAAAAVGAWWAARASSQASAAMTAIERRRWHADLTPQFELACRVTSGERATLRVTLVGPAALDRLDRVTVRIRDDIPGRAPVTPDGPTAEEIARQVWGPYRFVPGVDGADQTGRSVAPFGLLLGDWRPLALERTPAPTWSADAAFWRLQYDDQPVRLTLASARATSRGRCRGRSRSTRARHRRPRVLDRRSRTCMLRIRAGQGSLSQSPVCEVAVLSGAV